MSRRRNISTFLLSARSAKSICMVVKLTVLAATMSSNLRRQLPLYPHFSSRMLSTFLHYLLHQTTLPVAPNFHSFLWHTSLLQVINPTIAHFCKITSLLDKFGQLSLISSYKASSFLDRNKQTGRNKWVYICKSLLLSSYDMTKTNIQFREIF